MSAIYIIRHGQASFGKENYDRLSDLGVRQAELLGDYFKRTGTKFDGIFCGSLERHIATCQILMARMESNNSVSEPRIISAFNEYNTFAVLVKICGALGIRRSKVIPSGRIDVYGSRIFQKSLR